MVFGKLVEFEVNVIEYRCVGCYVVVCVFLISWMCSDVNVGNVFFLFGIRVNCSVRLGSNFLSNGCGSWGFMGNICVLYCSNVS